MPSSPVIPGPLEQAGLRFIKVEQFFEQYETWTSVTSMQSYSVDATAKTVSIVLENSDHTTSGALLQFLKPSLYRFRFSALKQPSDFTGQNTRSVVMDTMDDLRIALESVDPFTIEVGPSSTPATALILTRDTGSGKLVLSISIQSHPFSITVTDVSGSTAHELLRTASIPLYFTPNGSGDCSVVHAIAKPPTARYIGFGEHGGKSPTQNAEQLTYFNFDNMRYKQVYNQGPLDAREPLYHSDPFFLELNGTAGADCLYGIFMDNPGQVCMDMGYANSTRYMLGTRFGDLDYYFIAGSDAASVVSDFTDLVGHARLKPRYSLGYHQGCYGYESWGDIYTAVNAYRAAGIPLDGIHVDVDVQNTYQTFTVDQSPAKFPNAQATFADLRAKGIKCSTNITPIISNKDPNYSTFTQGLAGGYFVADMRCTAQGGSQRPYQDFNSGTESSYTFTDPERNYNSGKPYIGEVYYGGDRGTTGHYADLARMEVRKWWGTQYQNLFDLGLEMVWQDMTTPAIRDTRGDMRGFPFDLYVTDDFLSSATPGTSMAIRVWNLYSYNLHKATYHGLNYLNGRDNKRNFIVGRGSFTGMHRFAALWTGDNASTWDFLRMNVAQVLSLGVSGIAVCGQDIGGFETDDPNDKWVGPELLMRWTMAGAFLPWFRNHYIRKGSKDFQEPYAYASVDVSQVQPPEARPLYGMVAAVCKLYIQRRYRMLQLFYDAMFENTLNGLPICRSMILTDSVDKTLYNDKADFLGNQFLLRGDLLIAPVLEPQSQDNLFGSRDVYLPAGSEWYCYMDNTLPLAGAIEGGTTIRGFNAGLTTDGNHMQFLLPTYVRAGAILPLLDAENYVGERKSAGQPSPLTFNIYPGAGGSYTLYLDDGVSRSSAPLRGATPADNVANGGDPDAKAEYREVLISHQYLQDGSHEVRFHRVSDNYTPMETFFYVAILHETRDVAPPGDITSGGLKLPYLTGGSPETRAASLSQSAVNAWYYNETIRITFLKIFDQPADIVFSLL